ncbi:hypothetical protein C8R44DRAFT_744502 [Mycena epipterygia]|nr:hypothetical protein C8R44DRAFT_744502 [Mycena epipterygia]
MSLHNPSHNPPNSSPPFLTRRKRVYIACVHCRKRKIKCVTESQEKPCERCAQKGLLCEYIAVAEEYGRSNSEASGGKPLSSPATPSTPDIPRPSRQSGGYAQSDVQISRRPERPCTSLDRPNLNAVNLVPDDFRPLTPFELRNRGSSQSRFHAGATYDVYRYGTMTDHVSRVQPMPHYPPTGLPQQEPTNAAYIAPYASIRYCVNQTYTRGVVSALQAHVIVAGFVDRRVANICHFLVTDALALALNSQGGMYTTYFGAVVIPKYCMLGRNAECVTWPFSACHHRIEAEYKILHHANVFQ